MGITSTIYHGLFKRTSTFALGICACTFFFERSFDLGSAYIFESHNKGKLWNDIKHNYEVPTE